MFVGEFSAFKFFLPHYLTIFSTPLPIVLSLSLPSLSFLIPSLSPCASLPLSLSLLLSGPEYQEVEVHLLREKTGFGFRILGGDEAVQAVSPDARDKARMGRAGQHTPLYTPSMSNLIEHTCCLLLPTHLTH